MVAKYLGQDCLYVSNPEAVNKMNDLLESKVETDLSESKFDKSSQERDAFLKMVNGL